MMMMMMMIIKLCVVCPFFLLFLMRTHFFERFSLSLKVKYFLFFLSFYLGFYRCMFPFFSFQKNWMRHNNTVVKNRWKKDAALCLESETAVRLGMRATLLFFFFFVLLFLLLFEKRDALPRDAGEG